MPTPPQTSTPSPQAERVLDDVFLTPRVVDETALTGYAESLRAIIRDADTRTTRLASTSSETDRICSSIREAASRLEQRTTASARVAKELDARAARAQVVVDRLAGAITDNGQLQKLASQIIERRRAELTTSVENAVTALTIATEHAQQRADAAAEKAAQAEVRAEAAKLAADQAADRADSRLRDLEQRLATITASADAATERASTAREALDRSATDALTRIKSAAAAALDHAERDAEAIRDASAAAISRCEERADSATTTALEAIEQLRHLAEDAEQRLATKAEQLTEAARPIEALAEKAQTLLSDEHAQGSLRNAIERAEAAAGHLAATTPHAIQLISRIDDARVQLSQSIDDSAAALDALAERKDSICASAERDIEAIAADVSPIQHAAAGLRKRLDDFEARIASISTTADPDAPNPQPLESLRAQTDEITASALQRIEEAGMWLVTLIQRAEALNTNEPPKAP